MRSKIGTLCSVILLFIVGCGSGGSSSGGNSTNANSPPVAIAGTAQSATAGTTVTLDGSMSSDPAGKPLTPTWTQTAGPPVALSNAKSLTPSFTAPAVSTDTALTFQLIVNNGTVDSTPATVNVTVKVPPSPTPTPTPTPSPTPTPTPTPSSPAPTANAGPDQSVMVGATVTLDGSKSSDPKGQPLTFTWTQTAGSSVTLANGQSAAPSFPAPAATTDTVLTFQLMVSNGMSTSAPATVNVTVHPVGPPPALTAEQTLAQLADQLQAGDMANVLKRFPKKSQDTLMAFGEKERTQLALALRQARLLETNDHVRVYGLPFVEQNGQTSEVSIMLTKNYFGDWIVISW